MKIKLLLFLFFSSWLCLSANETVLVVNQTGGKKVSFLLSEKPVMTIAGKACVFTSKTTSVRIERKDIADFHFEDFSTDVEKIQDSDIHTQIADNSTLCISGVNPSDISVFSVDGKMANAEIQGSKEKVTVSLQQLPQGIYFVKFAGNTIKILK